MIYFLQSKEIHNYIKWERQRYEPVRSEPVEERIAFLRLKIFTSLPHDSKPNHQPWNEKNKYIGP
ncbi:MAG: hypothetical protein ACREOB_01005 [Thermodesulfobacteriota bacterium]